MSSEKCKLKQWDTPTHLLEWPLHTYWNGQNQEPWQHQMLARMWSRRNSHSLLMGLQNGTATLKDSLVVSYEMQHTLTTWLNNQAPWYLPKGVENMTTQKPAHGCFSSFIYNFQNLEATKISFSRWMNKYTLVHLDTRMLFYTLDIHLSMNI